MSAADHEQRLEVIEICAGAGGQSFGLHQAGFTHLLAVELDKHAAHTLDQNLRRVLKKDGVDVPDDLVRVGDVADPSVWDPDSYKDREIALLAGGVPCPPFSIAGKQLGSSDERDLFAWAIELCGRIRPKALLLENVRGLSANRFSGYRQAVLDKLHELGYIATWQLLHASHFGVPQLRPRFVLVALLPEYAEHFHWPQGNPSGAPTVGQALADLMGANGWGDEEVDAWVKKANEIAPTIVGGSKKHGGADLGPTRAKRAWAELGVDAMGVANEAPEAGFKPVKGATGPKLTTQMVARLQGWRGEFADWEFLGLKTSVYRQIGNAFPPPVAKALGEAIRDALLQEGEPHPLVEASNTVHDPVYKLLRQQSRPLTVEQIITRLVKTGVSMDQPEVERRLNHLGHDFELEKTERTSGELAYSLGQFKAFVGQDDHQRHDLFTQHRAKIS
ncbi:MULTISPECIES: DNA cytosine methyltransferase [unclassified Streptomyces]|uniref:DNA cytosine methyltransferase n=1 Tax=unclassified Streptomyces TaxID=2593676 RepID=UPI00225441BC|nr:DNA (cytosine-5-)-methyltransferase [Streptomyces sp. NBC_00452]MCX5056806.1 DNA (cytosine-5-)-methyltransferase [Streptomyces sp. NBC_00452]